MLGIIGIVTLLTVLGLSLLITRLATTILQMTGLSHEAARFQARSAFTGTGFTSEETEAVMNHPVRRRIIMGLMILRGAGLLTIVLSLILSFVGTSGEKQLYRLLWLCGGIAVLWYLAGSKVVERFLERMIKRALDRWTRLEVRDYTSLLKLSGEYGVTELKLEDSDWLAGKSPESCQLREEGINILGIQRSDGSYVGVPKSTTKMHAGDTLILYGRRKALEELDERLRGSAGDVAHEKAVDDQKREMAEQDQNERDYERKKQKEETD